MEQFVFIVLGFVLAMIVLSPFVPGLRPIMRRVVIFALAAISGLVRAVATALDHWKDLVAEARAERDAAVEAKVRAAEAEHIAISLDDK